MKPIKSIWSVVPRCLIALSCFATGPVLGHIDHCFKNVGNEHIHLQGINDAEACKTLGGSWKDTRPHCHVKGDPENTLWAAKREEKDCIAKGGEWYDGGPTGRRD